MFETRLKRFMMSGGGSVIIDRESVESVQSRLGGGVIVRTRQGGVYTVDATMDDAEAWLSPAERDGEVRCAVCGVEIPGRIRHRDIDYCGTRCRTRASRSRKTAVQK